MSDKTVAELDRIDKRVKLLGRLEQSVTALVAAQRDRHDQVLASIFRDMLVLISDLSADTIELRSAVVSRPTGKAPPYGDLHGEIPHY